MRSSPRLPGRRIAVEAPAKINLVLDLLGPRDDGYTEIATVFQTVAFGDTVEIAASAGGSGVALELIGAPPAAAELNLAVLAAEAYRAASGWAAQVAVRLTKRIPVGAGLGGGSSDAAAVLRALDRLAPRPLGLDRLAEIGGRLGADVPYFLWGGLALGRGRGDRLELLPDLPPIDVVLARIGSPLSTEQVFRAARGRLTRREDPPNIHRFLRHLARDSGGVPPLANELEPAAAALRPEIGRLLDRLTNLGGRAGMSGSGSAVFGLFPSGEAARGAAGRLADVEPDAWIEVTRTTARVEGDAHGESGQA